MSEKDWFDMGYDGLDEADEEYSKRMSDEIQRFYLKPKEEKEVVFETDDPLCFWEHQLYLEGSWFNYFTCKKASADGCEICNGGDKPSYVGVYIVRNLTGFKTKKGQGGIGRRELFVGKRKTLRQIQKFKDRRGTLVGKKFAVSRADDNSPNCGDTFDYLDDVELSTLPDPGHEMPKLMDLFKPLSNAELKALLGKVGSGGKSSGMVDSDSDVPF